MLVNVSSQAQITTKNSHITWNTNLLKKFARKDVFLLFLLRILISR